MKKEDIEKLKKELNNFYQSHSNINEFWQDGSEILEQILNSSYPYHSDFFGLQFDVHTWISTVHEALVQHEERLLNEEKPAIYQIIENLKIEVKTEIQIEKEKEEKCFNQRQKVMLKIQKDIYNRLGIESILDTAESVFYLRMAIEHFFPIEIYYIEGRNEQYVRIETVNGTFTTTYNNIEHFTEFVKKHIKIILKTELDK